MSGTTIATGNIDATALPVAAISQFSTLRVVAVSYDSNGVPIESYGINANDLIASGAAGATIIDGSGTPSSTIGIAGDYYLDTISGDFYGPLIASGGTWSASLFSIKGTIGATGEAGAAGSVIYPGSGAPPADVGNVNDYYVDETNYVFYGPKSGSTWAGAPSFFLTAPVPVFGASATLLSPGSEPTISVSGTTLEPFLEFGIPAGQPGGSAPTNILTVTSGTIPLTFASVGDICDCVTITGNTTFSISGGSTLTRQNIFLQVSEDSVGGHSITFPSNVAWAGGLGAPIPTTTPNARNDVNFYSGSPNGQIGGSY